jgi:hypothetical protein
MNIGVIGTSLSRSEMRKIMAGSGPGALGGGGSGGSCSTTNTAFCFCGNGSIEEHCALPTGAPNYHCNCYGSYIVGANWGITQWCCDQFSA